MTKKDIDPANVRSRPIREEGVDTVGVIDSVNFGAFRPEYYQEELGLANKRAGINTPLAARARATVLQAACKR